MHRYLTTLQSTKALRQPSLDLLQAHTGQVKYTLPLAHLAEGPNDTDPPDYGSIGSGPQSTATVAHKVPQASEVSKSKQETHPPLP